MVNVSGGRQEVMYIDPNFFFFFLLLFIFKEIREYCEFTDYV